MKKTTSVTSMTTCQKFYEKLVITGNKNEKNFSVFTCSPPSDLGESADAQIYTITHIKIV